MSNAGTVPILKKPGYPFDPEKPGFVGPVWSEPKVQPPEQSVKWLRRDNILVVKHSEMAVRKG